MFGIFVCQVPCFIVCLVSSFRYNGLATLALAGPSGPRAGPSGPLPQCTKNGGGADTTLLLSVHCRPEGPAADAKRPHAAKGRKSERSETVVPEATDYRQTIKPGTRQTKMPHIRQTKSRQLDRQKYCI